MSVCFRVHKKESPNSRVLIYLSRRDFIDSITDCDVIDGVALIKPGLLGGKKILGQLVCAFRYGDEETEPLNGLSMQRELVMDECQIYPQTDDFKLNRMQEKLLEKLGDNAVPLKFRFPHSSPTSVTIVSRDLKPKSSHCGVEYFVRLFLATDFQDSDIDPGYTLKMGLRKIQFAPTKPGIPPKSSSSKDFLFAPGEIHLDATLDRQLYFHDNMVQINISVRNDSTKCVKKIHCQLLQFITMGLSTNQTYKVPIAAKEEECKIEPSSTLKKTVGLRASFSTAKELNGFQFTSGMSFCSSDNIAIQSKCSKNDKSIQLASSTLFEHSSSDDEDDDTSDGLFGVIVSYVARVKLLLGAIGGELCVDLPFILMFERPNMKRIIQAGSVDTDIHVTENEPVDDTDFDNKEETDGSETLRRRK